MALHRQIAIFRKPVRARMRGFTIEGESHGGAGAQPCLFPGDLSPIG